MRRWIKGAGPHRFSALTHELHNTSTIPDREGPKSHNLEAKSGSIQADRLGRLEVRAGFCSERGPRPRNEDYAAVWLGKPGRRALQGVIAAVADGVGGAKGGRVAAELAVRGLFDGLLGQSEALGVRRGGPRG